MKKILFFLVSVALTFASCNQTTPQNKPADLDKTEKITLYFDCDSTLKIVNSEAREQLTKIAKDMSVNSDRIMITSYSEHTGDKGKNEQIAHDLGWAAKRFLRFAGAKDYNIGLDLKGYENPINDKNPADLKNRRIEITYM